MDRILYHNARIQTQDPHLPLADAMVIEGGKIIAVGTREEVRPSGPFDQEIDMLHRVILPGFNDAHVHLWN